MILYLDSSAIVKRYVTEAHSKHVRALMDEAEAAATSMVSRVEVAAAFAGAVRLGVLSPVAGRNAQRRFADEWPVFVRVPVTEILVARADGLAWEHGLRGYDAVQLASALVWQDAIGRDVVFATVDQVLMTATGATALQVWSAGTPDTRTLMKSGVRRRVRERADGGPPDVGACGRRTRRLGSPHEVSRRQRSDATIAIEQGRNISSGRSADGGRTHPSGRNRTTGCS